MRDVKWIMYSDKKLTERIETGEYDRAFAYIYGEGAVRSQRERYNNAVIKFCEIYGGGRELMLFSAPGRTEIGGNHTDHNHGRVLAAAVNLDIIAVVSPSSDNVIRIKSEGFEPDELCLDDLSVKREDMGRSSSLIRGLAERFRQNGLCIGGFDAYTTSNVLKGSGLSSSAAFEVLVGTVLNHLYNDGGVDRVEIAKMAQYAENKHFGKPSGLMDQMTSSVGGIITIDFEDTSKPIIKKVDFDFAKTGHSLCIVDTGGNHADLTPEYASITQDMKAVSESLGVSFLRQAGLDMIFDRLPELRLKHGDRAVLRAIHYFRDNLRVENQAAALERGDFETFKRLIVESGHSSFEYLQNVYAAGNPCEQGLSIALCIAQGILGDKGAWRVHGGGFAGTTQNFVPSKLLPEFLCKMENVFGKGTCHVLTIRPVGGVSLDSI